MKAIAGDTCDIKPLLADLDLFKAEDRKTLPLDKRATGHRIPVLHRASTCAAHATDPISAPVDQIPRLRRGDTPASSRLCRSALYALVLKVRPTLWMARDAHLARREPKSAHFRLLYWPQLWVIDFWLLRTFSQIIAPATVHSCPMSPLWPLSRRGRDQPESPWSEASGSHLALGVTLSRAYPGRWPDRRFNAWQSRTAVASLNRPRRQPRRDRSTGHCPGQHRQQHSCPTLDTPQTARSSGRVVATADIWRSPPLRASSAAQA